MEEKTVAPADSGLQEYGEKYEKIRWITGPEADIAAAERADLLKALSGTALSGYKDTKLDCRNLSPGCRICGDGAWSCLFINGKCPCHCFFCPTSQDEIGVPTTHRVRFRKPAEYVAYLEKFDFRGASMSGGEPFLTLKTSLAFVSAVKRKFGDRLHIWLYTSGMLANTDDIQRLRDAGVDEMRFNIAATGYSLDSARKAVGIIPTVTVETPAVPEAFEALRQAIDEMPGSGIRHLNLHQLRLTPFNFDRMTRRGYRFLSREKVTVPESELTALRLMRHAIDHRPDLPVNYCSFVYKNRFQAAAFRKRNATHVRKAWEDVTESGYIRDLWVTGDSGRIADLIARLTRREDAAGAFRPVPSENRVHLGAGCWDAADAAGLDFHVAYSDARIEEAVSYRHAFAKVALARDRQVFVEKRPMSPPIPISRPVRDMIRAGGCPDDSAAADRKCWDAIRRYEIIPSGLQDYR